MKNIKLLLLALVLINVLVLSSCIDINRNYKINADGSGSVKEEMKIDKEFYTMLSALISSFDTNKSMNVLDTLYNHKAILDGLSENLKFEGFEIINMAGKTNEDSSVNYQLEYKFDKVDKIGKTIAMTPDKYENSNPNSTVKWDEKDDKIIFSLKFLNDNSDNNENSFQGLEELMANKNLTIEIEFPYAITKTNAKEYNGKTAKWIYPVKELSNTKTVIFLEAKLKK